jgi:hypothetical protein
MPATNSTRNPDGRKTGKTKHNQLQKKSRSTAFVSEKVKPEDGILVDTARKIETGTKVVGEKAVDLAEKLTDNTTEMADIVYDKFKKKVSSAYHVSSRTIGDIRKTAAKNIRKYGDTVEMKKLNHDRKIKFQELGTHIYTIRKSKSQKIEELLADNQSQKILKDLEKLNKDIVKIGKKIKM